MEREASIVGFGEYLKRRSPGRRTATDYVSDVRQLAQKCEKAWQDVSMLDIDQFVDEQRQAGLSAATVRRRVAALKVFFDYLAEESNALSWVNPVRYKRHAGKPGRQLPRDVRDEEVERVWAVIESARDRAWFALMLRGGLRVGEVAGLKVADVLAGPEGGASMQVRVCGKGRKERMIPLTADAYAVVAQWLAERPTSSEPYVFLNDRGAPLQANGIEWLLGGYGAQAQVHLTPHQLRHTYARQLTDAGLPITSLGKLLGHEQISTTLIYTAGADPRLRDAYQEAMTRVITTPLAPTAPTATLEPLTPAVMPTDEPPGLPDLTLWAADLPSGLRQPSLDYVLRLSGTWNPLHRRALMLKRLGELQRYWYWQQAHRPLTDAAHVTLQDLRTYQSEHLARGMAASTINRVLSHIPNIVRQLAEQDQTVATDLFRYRLLPCPESLPRFLSLAQAQTLDGALQARLADPDPMARLETACFAVLAYTGLRAGECLDLTPADVDLAAGRLRVREGKGRADRVVYLSTLTRQALGAYMSARALTPTARLFRHPAGHAISSDWLRDHLRTWAAGLGVPAVSPHRMRHTLATRLLNAGMDITRIQKLLGHRHVTTTMIYAHVLDTTLEADYRRAMLLIERVAMPLSSSPLPATAWPTIPATPVMIPIPTLEGISLDNSI